MQEAALVSQVAVWISRVTQVANHFPVGDGFVRDSTADSSLRKRRARLSLKRKCEFSDEIDSARVSISQAERMMMCPKVAAIRERLRARFA